MLKNSIIFAFLTFLSRILGFIRDILIAKFIGISNLSDAFFTALKIPNFFRRTFAEGAFNSAFTPIYSSQKNSKDANLFASNILFLLIFILLVLIILIQIFMPVIIKTIAFGFNDNPKQLKLTANLTSITIFYLFFVTITSFFGAILNTKNKFGAYAASPIILNATFIFFILVLQKYHQNLAYTLSWALFFGGIFQLITIILASISQKCLIYPKFTAFNDQIKLFWQKFLPAATSASITQLNLLIDVIIATTISGAVSILYFADRINQLPLALIGIAISTVLLPNLSQKLAQNNLKKADQLCNQALFYSLFLALPAACGLITFANLIISTLFERGAFDTNKTITVALALKFYAIALPAFILNKIISNLFFAHKNTSTPMKITIITLIINVTGNIILIQFYSFLGIIIATIIAAYFNIITLIAIALKNNYFTITKELKSQTSKILICCTTMTITALIFNNHFTANFHNIIQLTSNILFALLIYFGCWVLIKNFSRL